MHFFINLIITGSLWGKPTWGIWWVWDARLTSMAILFLFYIAYILTWKFIDSFEKANKISSIIGIIGLFNLPVIKYSVDWWNTLHQPSSITLTSAPTIHHTMLVPLIIMLFGLAIFSLIIFLMKYKTELIKYINFEWKKLGTFDEDIFENLLSHDLSLNLELFGMPKKIKLISKYGLLTTVDRFSLELYFNKNTKSEITIDRTAHYKKKTVMITTQINSYIWDDDVLFKFHKKTESYKKIFYWTVVILLSALTHFYFTMILFGIFFLFIINFI